MIISIEDIMSMTEFSGQDEKVIQRKLDALEIMIRKYTNNNFQNRNVRFIASSNGKELNGVHQFIRVGDTVQISESEVNDGVYVVEALDTLTTTVNEELFHVAHNLVTKVEYPLDIKEGIINLMKWDVQNRDKIGIASETISRHSVSYVSFDGSNTSNGYPLALVGFLKPYMKARW